MFACLHLDYLVLDLHSRTGYGLIIISVEEPVSDIQVTFAHVAAFDRCISKNSVKM